jgi:outer membrane protein assembly factor BamB
MVPALSRRRLLAAAGTLAVGTGIGTALASSSAGSGSAWPMARHGPAGRSHAPDARPPRDGVAVRWKRPVDPDRGFAYGATPVVADGRVYVAGDDLRVFDAATGRDRLRVDRELGTAAALAPARAYTSPTLAVVESGLIGGLHANGGLDLFGSQAGVERWSISQDRGTPVFPNATPEQPPPVAAGETLLFATAGGLLAVDASSGRVRWRADVDGSRPVVHDGTVYVSEFGEGVVGHDLRTGDRTFESSQPTEAALGLTAGPSGLVVATDSGLAGLGYGGSVRWRFRPDDLSRDRGAVALADGVAYAGFRGEDDDWLVAVDAAEGTERWRSPAVPASEPQFAPPAVADGVVYVPERDRGMTAVDAADGSVRWRFDPDDRPLPWSPAALAGDALYAVGNQYVYALEEA